MLYHAPTGSIDPNAGYLGKNVAAGRQGSPIPPAVPEFVQREIVAAIIEAGIAPTDVDLKQMMRAIRSGAMSVYQDTGVPNALIATSVTAHTSYRPGLPLCIKLANDITGGTTLNLDGLGVLPVVYPGGGPLQRFDFLANDVIAGRINTAGTAFIVLSPINGALIDTAVTASVYGTGARFPDLNAAIAWVNRRRIALTGSVTFQLAAGVGANKLVCSADIVFQHPDGQRIAIQGQPLGGVLPAGSALTFTGTGTAARASDTSLNLVQLRNVYNTEIAFTNGKTLRGQGFLGNLQDILFTSDGSVAAADNIVWQSGYVGVTRIASVGAGNRGFGTGATYVALNGSCYFLGNGGNGLSAEASSTVALSPGSIAVAMSNTGQGVMASGSQVANALGSTGTVYARGNAADGVVTVKGVIALPASAVSRDNANNNFECDGGRMTVSGTLATNAGFAGYASGNGGFIDASNTTGTGNLYAYYAANGGNINRTGGTTAGSVSASPAVGSAGNNNAYIS